MKIVLKILLKIVIGFILLILSLLILSGGTFFIINKTGHINGVAQRFMNHYLVGEMRFDSLHFDFSEFPVIEVSARNGVLLSDTMRIPTDTLAAFHILVAKMNPFKIFTDNLIDIPYVFLDKPQALVMLNDKGRPGWAIWRFKKKKKVIQGEVVHKRPPIKLNISHVEIYGHPKFYYRNYHTGMIITADAADLYLIGRIAIDYKKIDADYFHLRDLNYRMTIPKAQTLINTRSDSIYIRKHLQQDMSNYQFHIVTDNDTIFVKGKPILMDNSLHVHGNVGIGYGYKAIQFNDLQLQLDTTTLWTRGNFRKVPGQKAMYTEMQIKLISPSINQTIYDLAPLRNKFPPELSLELPLHMRTSLEGIFSPAEQIYPDIFTTLQLGPGEISYKHYPIMKPAEMLLRVSYLTQSKIGNIYLDTLRIYWLQSYITMQAGLLDFLHNPQISARTDFKFNIPDLHTVISAFPMLQGRAAGNIVYRGPLKPLFQKNFLYSDVQSLINVEDVDYHMADSLSSIQLKRLAFQAKYPKSSDSDSSRSVSFQFYCDSAKIRKDKIVASIPQSDLNLVTYLSDALNPQKISGILKNQHPIIDFDQNKVHATSFVSHFSASLDSAKYQLDSLQIKSAVHALYAKIDTVEAISQNLGFFFALTAKDSIIQDTLSNKNNSLNNWVKHYDYEGGMVMKKSLINTPILPLHNEIDHLQLFFNPNLLQITDLKCKSGESSLNLSVTVNNLPDFLLYDSMLVANVNVNSDSLNLTQLIPALTKGTFYMNKRRTLDVDSLVERLSPPQLIPPTDSTKRTRTKMFQIPVNLNARIKVDASNVTYDKTSFDESHGSILVTDRSIFVHNVFIDSNLGNLDVGMSYQPSDSAFAHTGIAINLKRLDVEKLLGLFPDLRKLVPMLQTLEGYVGCSLAASADLDSTLYVNMPTLRGNAQIEGTGLSVDKDKILPTFVGWLLFGKNKKIELDSIGINLSMQHNVLSIYPFLVDLGRYRILASGVQDTDDSFFYHFSLQKWFLPFKVGFNIYKKNKKLHFRLACPKLRSIDQAARILDVDPIHLYPSENVGKSISKGIKKQQSVFLKFSDYYDSILNSESEEFSKKQTDAILLQLDSLRQLSVPLQK